MARRRGSVSGPAAISLLVPCRRWPVRSAVAKTRPLRGECGWRLRAQWPAGLV